MKRRKPGAIRGQSRRPAPDGYFEAAFTWRTAHLGPFQQILLNGDGHLPLRRRWYEWVGGAWREIE